MPENVRSVMPGTTRNDYHARPSNSLLASESIVEFVEFLCITTLGLLIVQIISMVRHQLTRDR